MKPVLKAPGTYLLQLQYDEPPSNFAFKFNLRHYSKGVFSKLPMLRQLWNERRAENGDEFIRNIMAG